MTELQDLFYSVFGPPKQNFQVHDNKNHFYIIIDVPGFDKDDLSVSVKNERLSICGQCEIFPNEKRLTNETFNVASNQLHINMMTATIKNGVLIIIIPKIESRGPRIIPINKGSD